MAVCQVSYTIYTLRSDSLNMGNIFQLILLIKMIITKQPLFQWAVSRYEFNGVLPEDNADDAFSRHYKQDAEVGDWDKIKSSLNGEEYEESVYKLIPYAAEAGRNGKALW